MFILEDNLKFINVDTNYLKSLHDVCDEVRYEPNGYDNKPFVGILINNDNRKYVIPLSSAKPKHKNWKNVNKEVYLIYEEVNKQNLSASDIWTYLDDENDDGIVKHILSVIDIKKMIPIKEGYYSIVSLNADENDTEKVSKYKDLLNKEYSFCLKILPDLLSKANKLYDKQMKTRKIGKFCCDFRVVENASDAYNA